jgi:hypothetical protein
MSIELIRKEYKKSLICWFFYDFSLPIIFICLFWPVSEFLIKIPYSFERIFSAADLFPIASLLMLSASREIDIETRLNRISSDMYLFKQLGTVFPLLLLCLYSIFKYYSMMYDFPIESNKQIDTAIKSISYLSFASVLMAGAFCFMVKWKIIRSLKPGIC